MNNFKKAYKNATKGKKHYLDVKFIERRGVNRYLRKLLREVMDDSYKVSKYDIYDKFTGDKWRTIYRLPMKDRIVQHAIMRIIEPVFRETFIVDTYSSIKYKGMHLALRRLKKMLKDNPEYKYCLSLDIHKCYPSLDKTILKQKVAKKFKDKKLLNLLYIIIDSCEKGVPIGNYTSQYFNNLYFSEFDHYIKETSRRKIYIRYCDNITIAGTSIYELRQLFNHIICPYISSLNVEIKPNWQIYDISLRGINALGFIIRRKYIKLRRKTKQRFKNACTGMNFDNLLERDINVLGSYWGLLKHGDCRNLWFKYTGVKTFKDLNINVDQREFIRNILNREIIVTSGVIYYKRGEKKARLKIIVDSAQVSVSTSAECIVEAIQQTAKIDYPFTTIIIVDDNGFYRFT